MEPDMQDLLGRLTALDPDASETLKVVSYFDALVARAVGRESLLRGAAMLSGATVGHRERGQTVRVRADGQRIEPDAVDVRWPVRDTGADAVVWLERTGDAHTNDAMILERLVLALGIVRARRESGPESAVELAISASTDADERAGALARLRVGDGPLRVVASPPDPAPRAEHPSSVVATAHGLTRATILPSALDPSAAWASDAEVRVGVGIASRDLAASWSSALIAVRLTRDGEPVVDAAELGAALIVAETAGRSLHPDAAALAALDPRALDLLDAVVDEQSVRAAAARLGRHHSSVQEKLIALVDVIGYDPRSPRGRTRFALARMLLRLRD